MSKACNGAVFCSISFIYLVFFQDATQIWFKTYFMYMSDSLQPFSCDLCNECIITLRYFSHSIKNSNIGK